MKHLQFRHSLKVIATSPADKDWLFYRWPAGLCLKLDYYFQYLLTRMHANNTLTLWSTINILFPPICTQKEILYGNFVLELASDFLRGKTNILFQEIYTHCGTGGREAEGCLGYTSLGDTVKFTKAKKKNTKINKTKSKENYFTMGFVIYLHLCKKLTISSTGSQTKDFVVKCEISLKCKWPIHSMGEGS